jgi:hypothetical protein
MITLKSIGVAVVLSAVIATPVLAQQAIQEPGMYAFYHPNGEPASNAAANAMASLRGTTMSVRIAPRHVARASTKTVAPAAAR